MKKTTILFGIAALGLLAGCTQNNTGILNLHKTAVQAQQSHHQVKQLLRKLWTDLQAVQPSQMAVCLQ